MTQAITLMCQGEIEQLSRRYDCRVTEANYLAYIYKKTAFFLSTCCLSGGDVCRLQPIEKKLLAA